MKRIVMKKETGDLVPDDAVYLTTLKQGRIDKEFPMEFVLHYFLVPVDTKDKELPKTKTKRELWEDAKGKFKFEGDSIYCLNCLSSHVEHKQDEIKCRRCGIFQTLQSDGENE